MIKEWKIQTGVGVGVGRGGGGNQGGRLEGKGGGATDIGGAGGRGELSIKEREGKQVRIIPRLFILFAPRIGKRKEFA
jgi:hypothetical protein